MKNKMIITVLTVCNIFMVSCSLNKSLYLNGQPLLRKSNMSHFIAPATTPSSVSIYSQIKALDNAKNIKSKPETILLKPNTQNQKYCIEPAQKIENLTYQTGDSIKLELNNGKEYFAVITKIEQEGYFIKVNNKRNIYISKKEIKKITVLSKAVNSKNNAETNEKFEALDYNNSSSEKQASNSRSFIFVLKGIFSSILKGLKALGKILIGSVAVGAVVVVAASLIFFIALIAIFL